jgi:PhnB protein
MTGPAACRIAGEHTNRKRYMSTEPARAVRPIPEGYAAVTPWVITDDTAAFIDFVRRVFGAVERIPPVYADDSTSRIVHAEVQIGDSVLMLFDRAGDWVVDTATFLNIYVDDCDAAHTRAIAAGSVEVTPLSTNAWGDRGSRIRDPFGNIWWIQTHVEDVSDEEVERRARDPHYVADLEVAIQTLDCEMRRIDRK